MSPPAYKDEDLELTTLERIEAAHTARSCGTNSVTKSVLMKLIGKRGRVEGVPESALLLTTREYLEVMSAWKGATS